MVNLPLADNQVPRSRTRPVFIFGTFALLAGGVVTYGMYLYANREYDSRPLQRIPKNAPFITSPDYVVNKMIEMANISDRDLVYDLGCGDGRIVITAAVQRGCRGIGFDIDPQR